MTPKALTRALTFFAAASTLALSAQAKGATVFVSQKLGHDDDTGAAGHPWRTLERAAKTLQPGSRLVVLEGRYAGPLVISASGTSAQMIEIVGQGRPLVEADQDAIAIRGDYVVLRGFEAHSTGWGSAINISKHNHHVSIIDNVARDSGCGGISAEDTDYLLIERNLVFGNARRAPWQCSGISLYQPEASDHAKGFHNVIRGNRIYDNMNMFVDENVSHSGGHTTDGNGVIVDDADHTQGDAGHTVYTEATLIENNVAFNNGGRGVHVFHSSNVVAVNNVVYKNLKDDNLQGEAAELSSAFSRGVVMANNIVVTRPGKIGLMDAYTDARNTWDYNLIVASRPWVLDQSPVVWGSHMSTGTDPQFVQPGLGATSDFRLRPSSPALRAGTTLQLGGTNLITIIPNAPATSGLNNAAACCGQP